jgi:hypothetical protein
MSSIRHAALQPRAPPRSTCSRACRERGSTRSASSAAAVPTKPVSGWWRREGCGSRRALHRSSPSTLLVTTYLIGRPGDELPGARPRHVLRELAALDGRPRFGGRWCALSRLGPHRVHAPGSLPRTARARNGWSPSAFSVRLADLARGLVDRVLELSTLSVQQRVCVELRCAWCAQAEAAVERGPHRARAPGTPSWRHPPRQHLTANRSPRASCRRWPRPACCRAKGRRCVVQDVAQLQRIVEGSRPPRGPSAKKPVRERTAQFSVVPHHGVLSAVHPAPPDKPDPRWRTLMNRNFALSHVPGLRRRRTRSR